MVDLKLEPVLFGQDVEVPHVITHLYEFYQRNGIESPERRWAENWRIGECTDAILEAHGFSPDSENNQEIARGVQILSDGRKGVMIASLAHDAVDEVILRQLEDPETPKEELARVAARTYRPAVFGMLDRAGDETARERVELAMDSGRALAAVGGFLREHVQLEQRPTMGAVRRYGVATGVKFRMNTGINRVVELLSWGDGDFASHEFHAERERSTEQM